MKKMLLLFISLFALTNGIEALELWERPSQEACTTTAIEQGIADLEKTTYELKYLPDLTDRDENTLVGYMEMTIMNMPSNYEAIIESVTGGQYNFKDNNLKAALSGGVYTIKYYNKTCTTPLKIVNFRIPFYKTYCGLDKNCDEDPWFDGTFENSASNQNRTQKTKLNIVLVIILVILILVILGFVFVVIKRRRDYEKSL